MKYGRGRPHKVVKHTARRHAFLHASEPASRRKHSDTRTLTHATAPAHNNTDTGAADIFIVGRDRQHRSAARESHLGS